MRATDVWDHWRKSLANPKAIGTYELPLFVDTPEVGYWRYFSKSKDRWIPVAFFISDDADEILCCLADGKPIEPMGMSDIWHRCCRHPISWKQYGAAVGGDGFADEPPPAPGHNLALDLAEQLRLEFEAEAEIVRDLLDQELNQDVADKCAVMAKRLSGLRGRADDEHTREKRPHLEAGRDVDDRWRFREGVTETVTQLKKHLQPWLDSHESGRRTGARVSLRTVMVGEITNAELFFSYVKDMEPMRELLQKIANKLAKAGIETPGMDIKEERRAI